ncbi:MAG: tetratricopeptide repeat protein [Pirellulaceae bacterium]|nr:tetratricopeptide repeat protein [Pirellulaceae bacterium]
MHLREDQLECVRHSDGVLRPPNRLSSGRSNRGRPFVGAGLWFVALALPVVLSLSGCGTGAPPSAGRLSGPIASSQRSHLDNALDYVSRLEDFEPQQGMMQVAYQLNRWLESADGLDEWEASPLLAGLPASLREIPPLARLDKREFTIDDVLYLREASWMKSVSQWVAERNEPVDGGDWLKQLEQTRGEPHSHDIALAMRLFDWTVRNIQLDPLLEFPAAQNAPPGIDLALWPLYQAEPGPGYRTWPWQTLMFGRGDAWQRARVFAGLARQQEIDVVVLAVEADSPEKRPRPWVAAALIDDDLYLFDPQLGLPIPGPDSGSVATLRQVRKDPSLLRRLDLGKAMMYPMQAEDLSRLMALLDAPPESLSYRMRRIETQPTSSPPLALSVEPAQLIPRLAASDLPQVRLWQAPLETWIYRTALKRRAEEDAALMQYLLFEEWIFDSDTPLVRARQLHLRGKFEQQDDRDGAKALYLKARVPNAMIAKIGTSPEVRSELGIVRGRQNDQQWEMYLQSSGMILVRTKQNASLWLGLIHAATGRYEDARDWFQVRCLEAYENGPWTNSARYNLARTHEQMGNLEAARQLYLLDNSPQQHGNLLRARTLRQRIEAKTPDKTQDDEP